MRGGSLFLVAVLLASPAMADESGDPKIAAETHFRSARGLYQEGRYPEAKKELLLAKGFDPKAKELLFNLGIVSEKLSEFDDAIAFFREYSALPDVTEQEKQKAEGAIRRIEGAKKNAPKSEPQVLPNTVIAPLPPRGRVDALTITSGGIAASALLAGGIFGIAAVATNPKSGSTTSASNSYDSIRGDAKSAHTFAIVSDVAFGVALVSAVVTAGLYFGRRKDAPTTTQVMTWAGPSSVLVRF